MSYTVFLGNLPVWVTADDIGSWLAADNLVADSIKVIRNPETQESKGFAFIEAPNQEEMDTIIRRFNHAPLEDRMLRANPAQPPKGRVMSGARPMTGPGQQQGVGAPPMGEDRRRFAASRPPIRDNNSREGAAARPPRTGRRNEGSPSAFAEELAKAL
jgi:RNA recognition motif-containing protein